MPGGWAEPGGCRVGPDYSASRGNVRWLICQQGWKKPSAVVGDSLSQLGRYEAARRLDEETLTRRRAVLGEDHPDTLTSANNLAADLYQLGRYEEPPQRDSAPPTTPASRRRKPPMMGWTRGRTP